MTLQTVPMMRPITCAINTINRLTTKKTMNRSVEGEENHFKLFTEVIFNSELHLNISIKVINYTHKLPLASPQ